MLVGFGVGQRRQQPQVGRVAVGIQHGPGHRVHDQQVRRQRQVRPVLLDRADGLQQDGGRGEPGRNLGRP
jgi:hypothetical protein